MRSGGIEQETGLINLSEGGCLLAAPCRLGEGAEVEIAFTAAALRFRCRAVVKHRTGGSAGLAFTAMDPAVNAGVRALVSRQQ